ncbi:hypothetical protein [Curtobacterium sp. Leaf261]|uniref:hypothetical protein n=1 Tax=Curtobacterium sp. Leaf261 TaxID=1736311 RepID=UPI0006F8609E|nr:hypothetical protein [Curtobacterium sp. Leaf261]KQO65083.1 hypothetical protein ASF23_02830 [Curtobacterium sp. Leaf261]
MTTNLALATPLPAAPGVPHREHRSRPELVEVTPTRAQRRARPRIVYAIIAMGALGILLLAQLGISMVLSSGAYTLSSLQAQQTELSRSQQQLDEQLSVLRSPQNLARNAQALGMIANSTPVYLDPKTGAVFGTPTAAAATDAAAATTDNQVPNSLLDTTKVVTKQGDTAASAEQPAGTAAQAATGAAATGSAAADPEKTGAASESAGGSSESSVSSDADQLQAPSTR